MPSSVVKSFAKKTNKSVAEVEKIWDKIKKGVEKSGISEDDPKFYKIITSTLKKSLDMNEDVSLNEILRPVESSFLAIKQLIKLIKSLNDSVNNMKDNSVIVKQSVNIAGEKIRKPFQRVNLKLLSVISDLDSIKKDLDESVKTKD